MTHTKLILSAALFALTVVLIGCGGGGGGSSSIATTFSISGTITGASGVTVDLTGANTASTNTNASGNYSFTGLTSGVYTVTPTLAGNTFTPGSSLVTVSGADVTGKDFVAIGNTPGTYIITGTVSGSMAQGVSIALTGTATASTTTNSGGNYSFANLANGTYTVTPSLSGYAFSPTGSVIIINGANSTANNFTSSTVSAATYSYSYYKRFGTTTAQTATLSNGTLSIDGKTITGIYLTTSLGGAVCFAGGNLAVLTSCASPANGPHTILLCGPDPVTTAADTLLYVLFDTPDSNRVAATSSAFLTALQSETNYLGTSVYTDCSGTGHTSWIRNYPNTNYYLWPDVFTTYTAVYVNNLLSGAVIYSTPTAGTNYNDYVAVRVSSIVFEVWH